MDSNTLDTNGPEPSESPCILNAGNLRDTLATAIIVLGSRGKEESTEYGPIERSPKLPLTLESTETLNKRVTNVV